MLRKGSPPRMRGKGQGQGDGCGHQGITPACAGKSAALHPERRQRGDHPRVCGEKAAPPRFAAKIGGSSPRVRGKEGAFSGSAEQLRITPACAGKRTMPNSGRKSTRDHPRVCGEKVDEYMRLRMGQGSPPRVRGKVRPVENQYKRLGITPACAGKSVYGYGFTGF